MAIHIDVTDDMFLELPEDRLNKLQEMRKDPDILNDPVALKELDFWITDAKETIKELENPQ